MDSMRRVAMGVAAVVMVSLLLAATAGGAWQTDVHMYYFAVLAVLAAYCDRNVIAVGAVVIAVHHLVLSFVAPALVFDGGADLGRVFLHAGIVLVEAATLIWLSGYLAHLIAANEESLREADSARAIIQAAGQRDAAERVAAEAQRDRVLALSGRFEATAAGIITSVAARASELQATAQSMSSIAEQTSRQSTAAAAASDLAMENVNTVAASTEELSASVREILLRVNQSTQLTNETVAEAHAADQGMQALASAMDRIGEVVGLINGIAGQTNLLALNATIEAARAGDAGKGFAVVASEVKALANQTAKATQEISTQIASIQEATRASAQSIQGIVARIGKMSEAATAIASAVEEQGAATAEIARNVSEAAKGTGDVSNNIAGVAVSARNTGAAADEVLASARTLSQNGEALQSQVGAFLVEVRAA